MPRFHEPSIHDANDEMHQIPFPSGGGGGEKNGEIDVHMWWSAFYVFVIFSMFALMLWFGCGAATGYHFQRRRPKKDE